MSGLYLITDNRLAAGDWLRLQVSIPVQETSVPMQFSLRGRVVRAEELAGGFGAGIVLDASATQFAWLC